MKRSNKKMNADAMTRIKHDLVGWRRDSGTSITYPGFNDGGAGSRTGSSGDSDGGGFLGMIFGNAAPPPPSSLSSFLFLTMLWILNLYIMSTT